jgi:cysteine-rich repeat protein
MTSYSWKTAANFLKYALSIGLLVAAGCSPQPDPTCTDGIHNGDETDIDCGGGCSPCADSLGCGAPGDCHSQVCERGVCTAPRCGDGVINQAVEDCDDAGESAGCDADCTAAVCGDGYTNMLAGEDCDDGNPDNADACLDNCSVASCGDGYVFAGVEECDDGNADDSDDCTSICELADCTDELMNADEIDVDCGGHCGPASCRPGQTCTGDSDCISSSCMDDVCTVHRAIATGGDHTCALDSAGAVRCWGLNGHGQLGYGHTSYIGDDEFPSVAGPVDVGGTVVQLAGGAHHTCALLNTGAVRCWGRNDYGQLGYGHTTLIGDDEFPSVAGDVDLGGTATQITAGELHTCALLDNGAVRCWGLNSDGQLGYGHNQPIGDDEPPSAAGDVGLGGTAVQVTAGGYHTCALLDNGAVRCWGLNGYGQLGYGHTQPVGRFELPSTAGDVDLGGTAVQVTAGGFHTCALLDNGAARCWGFNVWSQLGYGHTQSIGDNELPSSAGPVSLGGTATHLISNRYHTCALLSSGALRCWGRNTGGELGYGHTQHIGNDELPSSAGDVSVGGVVAQMALGGGYHTCALLDTGAVRCWGQNTYGQLGYGHTSPIGDDELPSSAGDVPYQ